MKEKEKTFNSEMKVLKEKLRIHEQQAKEIIDSIKQTIKTYSTIKLRNIIPNK